MKKIVSIMLLLAMVCCLFAGCGGSGDKSAGEDSNAQVTLIMALPHAEQKDSKMVLTKINEALESKLPNTTLEILYDSSMAEKWSLWMSTKKHIDIAHSGFVTDLENEVNKKSYKPLDELVEEYAPNISKLKKDYWYSYDNATVGGNLYAIPNIQYYIKETTNLRIFNEAVPYIDTAALKEEAWSSDKTTAKFYSILTSGIEKAQAAGVDCSGIFNLSLYNIAKRGYNFIGGEDSNLCYDNSDSGKVINFYDTQEFSDFCSFMKTGADKGWVSKDVLTGQWSDKLYASVTYRLGMDPDTAIREGSNDISLGLDNPDRDVVKTSIGQNASYWSIPFTSENPVRAIKFLDLINSDEGTEIVNLLAYGIEGTHYEFTDKENGDINAFEYIGQGSAGNSYGVPNWMVGNMLLGMYNITPYSHEYKDYANDYYLNRLNNTKKHVLYGMEFNLDEIRTDLNKIIKNNGEYAESIYCGVVGNADKMLSELTDKNNSAGYEKVREALQKQVDDYLASK